MTEFIGPKCDTILLIMCKLFDDLCVFVASAYGSCTTKRSWICLTEPEIQKVAAGSLASRSTRMLVAAFTHLGSLRDWCSQRRRCVLTCVQSSAPKFTTYQKGDAFVRRSTDLLALVAEGICNVKSADGIMLVDT